MPKGHPLTTEQRKRIYDLHTMNVSHEDIADQFGVTVDTINRCVGKQRKLYEQRKEGQMAEIVVDGDKRNGRLVSNGTNRYEGTCIVKGKSKSRAFLAGNAHVAEEQWRKWCQDLRDEQAFMDMVECKEPEPQPLEEIVPIEPAPMPDIEVKPWKDVAEERQARIEELEARVAQLEDKERVIGVIDGVISDTEGETPKLGHWFNDNGSFRVFWMNKPVYVLWAKADKPKLYGVYRTMELALGELDKLNEVAAFLGNGDVFEVEEVVWK